MPDVDGPEARNPFSGPRADLGRRAEATDTIIVGVAVVAGLYFGREVLVPMSIAILLSFVLAPVTDVLSRLRVSRVASALIAVALAFAILGILGAIIGRQTAQLSENLPAYQVEISKKLDAVRSSAFRARMVEKAADALHGLENNIGKNAVPAPPQSAQGQTTQAPDHPLVRVEVHEPPAGLVQILQSVLSALLPPLATAAIVIIFVVFILLQRRDLRDRFIGLIGSDDLHCTTKALDDAAQRFSRYFLALTGINASFGIIIGLGLSLIGVPNPVLWGIVGAVLRFVPYAGPLSPPPFLWRSPRLLIPDGAWSRRPHYFSSLSKGSWGKSGAAVVRPHHRYVAARHHCRRWILDPYLGRAGASSFDAHYGLPSVSGRPPGFAGVAVEV
jgi:predicted PurR-regulated permease PerM